LSSDANPEHSLLSGHVLQNGSSQQAAVIEPWIGVDDLALVLGVSSDWVYEKAAAGELPSYKLGGHRRFRISEVEGWASQCASGKMAPAAPRPAEDAA
jgi:excisionase family DNA binding protein